MLFRLIRILLCVIIITIGIIVGLFTKNRCKWNKKIIHITIVIVCILSLLIVGMPLENLFYEFGSPDEAFCYGGIGQIEHIVSGEDTCLIVYSKGKNEFGRYIVRKTATGYQLPNPYIIKKVATQFTQNASIYVYNIRRTNDFYVLINSSVIGQDTSIDVYHKTEKITCEIFPVGETDCFYFYLPEFDNAVYLLIDGEPVYVTN